MSGALCYRRLAHTIKTRFHQPNRNGYIVLLPEIAPNVPENYAFMKDDMPDFSSLTLEKCVNTFGRQMLNFEQGIRDIEQNLEKAGCSNIVKDVIEPIERLSFPLETSWGIIKNLYLTQTDVMPSANYLPLHHRARKSRSAKFYSKAIYNACKNCDQSQMSEEDQRLVDKFILEGRLAGLELEEDKRELLANIHIKLAEHRSDYLKRIEISATLFNTVIRDPAVTSDMPDHLLREMAENKDEPSRGPWRVKVGTDLTETFLAYCPKRSLRQEVWEAETRLASKKMEDSSLHNSITVETIRTLRKNQAKLLGYKTYADLSMETKMAGTVDNVRETLHKMLKIAKPAADRELVELLKFALERGFEDKQMQVWDVPFWRRKQCRTLFNFQEETLTDYFPFEKVWEGLIGMSERLFDLKIVEKKNVDSWHPDVKFFQIFEDSNKPVAGFYLDPYTREGKMPSPGRAAWGIGITPAARMSKTLPLSTFVLHLDSPIYGKPALLTYTDVQVLFKQFGHLLQQLLTTVTYSEVAGSNNVEWDAVEVVSNVFLHLLKEPEVLESASGHYATGEKLPALPIADIDKHFAGYRLCEELFKANLDLELYATNTFWLDIMKKLWPSHFLLPFDGWNATPCNFPPIITEQWYAAYYSHVWAKMLAADVYSAFTETDVDVKSVGTRFRDTFLAFGGGCHPSEVFRRFRGRDPSSEAYLKHLGLH